MAQNTLTKPGTILDDLRQGFNWLKPAFNNANRSNFADAGPFGNSQGLAAPVPTAVPTNVAAPLANQTEAGNNPWDGGTGTPWWSQQQPTQFEGLQTPAPGITAGGTSPMQFGALSPIPELNTNINPSMSGSDMGLSLGSTGPADMTGAANNGGIFQGGLDWLGNNKDGINAGLGLLGSGMGLWTGFKGMGLASDMYKNQRDMQRQQLQASRTDYNNRANARNNMYKAMGSSTRYENI